MNNDSCPNYVSTENLLSEFSFSLNQSVENKNVDLLKNSDDDNNEKKFFYNKYFSNNFLILQINSNFHQEKKTKILGENLLTLQHQMKKTIVNKLV